jgi:glycosyltransferase involved in cell wall biosynthesis
MPWAKVIHIENHHYWGKKRDFLPHNKPSRILLPLNFFEYAASRTGYFPEILAFSLRAFRKLKALFKNDRADIVHDVETLGYGLLLAKGFGVPIVSTVHHPLSRDMMAFLSISGGFKERYHNTVFFPLIMQRLVIRGIDTVITSSRIGVQELKDAFGVRKERIRLVFSGIDVGVFKENGGGDGKRQGLLFVGNAQDPKKGIITLLEAMTLLDEEVCLTIVDEGEPAKFYAPALVRKMGLSERVTFTGRLSEQELVEYYRCAELVVVPSLFEGFGLPAVEAMACGTPVVATTMGALSEVIGDDGAGVLIPPGDCRALARAIEDLLVNEDQRIEMGRRGRKRVEENFCWIKTAEETTKVYRELLQMRAS